MAEAERAPDEASAAPAPRHPTGRLYGAPTPTPEPGAAARAGTPNPDTLDPAGIYSSARATPSPAPTTRTPHPRALTGTRWVLKRCLGVGGMSEVYLAEHAEIGKRVAIKMLNASLADQPEALERLRREALLAARIGNPHIVEIYDLSTTHAGRPYVVMEYVPGQSLQSILAAEAPLSPSRVVDLCAQICDALQAAHDEGVIHRDLKPENIMITDDGRVVVLDFGIACESLRQLARLTLEDHTLGTPGYMAPEQVSAKEVDGRADQYGVAMIAYEALAGRHPYRRDTPLGTMQAQLQSKPPPIRDGEDHPVPAALEAVVFRGLSRNRAHRFPTVAAFAEALQEALEGPATAAVTYTPVPLASPAAPSRRDPWRLAVTAAVAALVALVLWLNIDGPGPVSVAERVELGAAIAASPAPERALSIEADPAPTGPSTPPAAARAVVAPMETDTENEPPESERTETVATRTERVEPERVARRVVTAPSAPSAEDAPARVAAARPARAAPRTASGAGTARPVAPAARAAQATAAPDKAPKPPPRAAAAPEPPEPPPSAQDTREKTTTASVISTPEPEAKPPKAKKAKKRRGYRRVGKALPPRLHLQRVELKGDASRRDVEELLASVRLRIRDCVQDRGLPRRGRRASVRFEIDADGFIDRVRPEERSDPVLGACARDALAKARRMAKPPDTGTVYARLPLVVK